MLGLADRSRVIDLFDALMRGDIAGALNELRDQYDTGADPAVVLADLAEFTHFVTRVKVVPAVADDRSLAEIERTRGRAFAAALSMRVLSRTWQMLLKGIPEVQSAAKPIAAAEMVLVRIAYAADLPTPDEVMRSLGERRQRAGAAAAGQRRWRRHDRATGCAARAAARRADGAAQRRRRGRRAAPQRQEPVARQVETAQPAAATVALARFEDLVALAAREARPADQVGARARRAAGALRGGPARDRAGAERLQGAGQRSRAQDQPVDRPALDGGGVGRAGPADHQGAERGAPRRARARRAGRSAGAGGAGEIPGRGDRRGARRPAGAAAGHRGRRRDAARAAARRRRPIFAEHIRPDDLGDDD